ncbi:Heat-stable enterotoxin receptor, partial [Frankliniella fusca]
ILNIIYKFTSETFQSEETPGDKLVTSFDEAGGNQVLLSTNCINPQTNITTSGSRSQADNLNFNYDNNKPSTSTEPGSSNATDEQQIDLTKYIPEEEINRLSDYERLSIENKIRLYLHCKSQGLHFQLNLPGIQMKAFQKSTQKATPSKPSSSKPLIDVTNSCLRRSERARVQVLASGTAQSSSDSDQSNSPRRKKRTRHSGGHSSRQDTNNEDEKALIRDMIGDESIPNYDVRNILQGKRGLERALHQLNTKGSVFGSDLKDVIDELVTHLFSLIRKGFNIPAEMKVGMAVSFVATFPKMCQALVSPDDKPWTWLFSREENCGKLANCVTSKQRQASHPKPRGGGLERRKNPAKPVQVERQALTLQDLNLSNEVKYLRVLLDNDRTRDTIERVAKETFEERRTIIKRQTVPLRVLLEAFPFLTFFRGAMIDFEFDLIYPGKGEGFLQKFHLLVPKLLKVAELDEKKYPPEVFRNFCDNDLNACLILAHFLPKPKKTYNYESNMNPLPDISDFFHVVPVGSNIQHEIQRRCIERNHPVQPYLLCLGHPRCLGKITLVWGDRESTDLPVGTAPLKAVDFLMKSFHVMQVPYYLGWKNFFRFISYHFNQINPDNKRLSVFTAQYMELNAIET